MAKNGIKIIVISSAETIKAEMQSPMKNPFYKLSKKWFNNPTFVELFDYRDRILILFREDVDDGNTLHDKRK